MDEELDVTADSSPGAESAATAPASNENLSDDALEARFNDRIANKESGSTDAKAKAKAKAPEDSEDSEKGDDAVDEDDVKPSKTEKKDPSPVPYARFSEVLKKHKAQASEWKQAIESSHIEAAELRAAVEAQKDEILRLSKMLEAGEAFDPNADMVHQYRARDAFHERATKAREEILARSQEAAREERVKARTEMWSQSIAEAADEFDLCHQSEIEAAFVSAGGKRSARSIAAELQQAKLDKAKTRLAAARSAPALPRSVQTKPGRGGASHNLTTEAGMLARFDEILLSKGQ